jgi:hypothetical protein
MATTKIRKLKKIRALLSIKILYSFFQKNANFKKLFNRGDFIDKISATLL